MRGWMMGTGAKRAQGQSTRLIRALAQSHLWSGRMAAIRLGIGTSARHAASGIIRGGIA